MRETRLGTLQKQALTLHGRANRENRAGRASEKPAKADVPDPGAGTRHDGTPRRRGPCLSSPSHFLPPCKHRPLTVTSTSARDPSKFPAQLHAAALPLPRATGPAPEAHFRLPNSVGRTILDDKVGGSLRRSWPKFAGEGGATGSLVLGGTSE